MSLAKYNQKRNFAETSEPTGEKSSAEEEKLSFVIQRHKASRLHYDFRLELDGVLKSWAVPKGPSLNPKDKRLAMMVEDHPYDYKDFEGVIPKGNYGAGIVEIWDKGTYDAVDEKGPERIVSDYAKKVKLLHAGLEAGNLKFRLYGKKLNGEFALVRLKDSDSNSWLLVKHRDNYAIDEPYNSEEHTPKNSPINKWLAEHKKDPEDVKENVKERVESSSQQPEQSKKKPRRVEKHHPGK
jgi:bifunctional non-homologous end joining protein LigD